MHRLLGKFKHSGPLLMFMAAAVALTIAVGSATSANAQSGEFCWSDPILAINGRTVNVVVGVMGSPADVRANVQHAHFRIFLPAGVEAEIVGYEDDYFTESAEIIVDDALSYVPGEAIEMWVEVTFQATKAFPALVYVMVDGESRQVANGISASVLTGMYRVNP